MSDASRTVVHVHLPRTAGTSLRHFFGRHGYRVVDLDINTNDFFTSIDEQQFRAERGRRRPHLFTGHLRLDHAILRLDEPITVISLLREPAARMLANYNNTLRKSGAPWHAEVVSGEMSFLDNVERYLKVYGPEYSYFDYTGKGDYQWTGTSSPAVCFENFRDRVDVFGFVERIDEFMAMLTEVCGLPAVPLPRENYSGDDPDRYGIPLKTGLSASEQAALPELLRDDFWFYEQALTLYRQRGGIRVASRDS